MRSKDFDTRLKVLESKCVDAELDNKIEEINKRFIDANLWLRKLLWCVGDRFSCPM